MTAAALAMTPAVPLIPSATGLSVDMPRSTSSRTRLRDEHAVVHREAEEDDEQEQRQPGGVPPTEVNASAFSPWPSWNTRVRMP